uniref:Striatin N-terminal domain-containing protein n=1 Tax=Ailuropoda melanoleuca TaxID=9646 RepID=A0A7N5JHG4_AILME
MNLSQKGWLKERQVEWAKLQTPIAVLQRKGKDQENLKSFVRIMLLAYALKQERVKYHKLYGTKLNHEDLKMPPFESEETKDTEAPTGPQKSRLE